MKFDMGAAWNEVVRLLSANRQVLLIVAGVFFFLPSVAFSLVFTNEMAAIQAAQAANPDPSAVGKAMFDFYGSVWWMILLIAVVQAIGMLGLLALLTDRTRPTVGEALKIGLKLLLPYIGAQLLTSCLLGILILFPLAVGASAGAAAGVLVGIVALVALIYLFVKFMLTPPVIAIERVTNPLTAMGRSWRLTKGNSLRLFGFVFLLVVALIVVSSVLGMIFGLIFALAGAEAALVGNALVSGLINAVFSVIFLAALAAIHRQLAGPAPETVGETFS